MNPALGHVLVVGKQQGCALSGDEVAAPAVALVSGGFRRRLAKYVERYSGDPEQRSDEYRHLSERFLRRESLPFLHPAGAPPQ
jgi:hypothetical protein